MTDQYNSQSCDSTSTADYLPITDVAVAVATTFTAVAVATTSAVATTLTAVAVAKTITSVAPPRTHPYTYISTNISIQIVDHIETTCLPVIFVIHSEQYLQTDLHYFQFPNLSRNLLPATIDS